MTMRKGVFIPSVVVLCLILAFGVINPEGFARATDAVFNVAVNRFGWLYLLAGLAFLIFIAVLYFSDFGKIRLGGQDAIPMLSTFNWFAISLCTGIAIGIIFWGVAEPIMHYGSPIPLLGAEPESARATIAAMEVSYLHWSFVPYAIYSVFGIAIAFAAYNLKRPMSMTSALYPLVGKRAEGRVADIVDSTIIVCFVGGQMASLGFASLQMAQGIQYIFGIPVSAFVYAIILAFVASICIVSSYSGIRRGIRLLSSFNVKLFFLLLTAVFVLGPTQYIINIGVESFGRFLADFAPLHMWTDANNTSGGWPGQWTIFYWAWWFIFGPTVGLFLAKISYGRTIRAFIRVTFLAPALFGVTWFTVMGGAALHMEHIQNLEILSQIKASGAPVAMYVMLENIPLARFIIPIALLAGMISYVTAMDSAITTISIFSTHMPGTSASEPPGKYKIVWGVLIGSLSLVLLVLIPGDVLSTLQKLCVTFALPIMLVGFLACAGLIRVMSSKGPGPDHGDTKNHCTHPPTIEPL